MLKELQPLREKGFLTTFADGTLSTSAVTVVGTGNSPLVGVKALDPRDYFFDAPLTQLTDPSLNTTWGPTLSPIASTDWAVAVGWTGIGNITETQLGNLTKFVQDAHNVGITARYWDLPGWPINARSAYFSRIVNSSDLQQRTAIWNQLALSGVDWLNADDLEAAAEMF